MKMPPPRRSRAGPAEAQRRQAASLAQQQQAQLTPRLHALLQTSQRARPRKPNVSGKMRFGKKKKCALVFWLS